MNRNFLKNNKTKAFTIIETLIVLALMAVFTGMALFNNGQARRALALVQEQNRLVSAFSQARAFTLQALDRNRKVDCGYGVHIESKRYILFRDIRDGNQDDDKCKYNPIDNPGNPHIYTYNEHDDTKGLEQYVYVLPDFLEIVSGDTDVTDVVFLAPNADTVITLKNGEKWNEASIKIKRIDRENFVIIKINKYGQISTTDTTEE